MTTFVRFLAAFAVGLAFMVCAPLIVAATFFVGMPAMAGLFVLQGLGVRWAYEAGHWVAGVCRGSKP